MPIQPIYTAVGERAAEAARDEMLGRWADKYPAIRGLWMGARDRFIPFLDYDVEIRRVRARGHFPDERAALKCLYLTVRSLDPTGRGRIKWAARWKPALNAFAITSADRWPTSANQ